MSLSTFPAVLANDKYRATTRATFIASPVDSSIQVTVIPTNVPTYVVLGWNTQYETLFKITGVGGTNSSNYTLTGLTVVKGYGTSANIPEGVAVNCLNNEEFFNQYGTEINTVIDAINALSFPAGAVVGDADVQTLTNKRITKRVASTTSTAAPTPASDSYDVFKLTAQAATAAFVAPSGTPTDSQALIMRIKDSGTARALTWASGTGGYVAHGVDLPSATVTGKYLHLAFMYVTDNSLNKWGLVAASQET